MLSGELTRQRHRARRPERQARARPARGRDHRPGRARRRGHDRDQHGGPRRRHQARRRPRADGPDGGSKDRPRARGRGLRGGGRRRAAGDSRSRLATEGEKVRRLGGLFICGTERHESRRIDNQLRGRSGRQGDPGESRFFLSAEDDLIRLFAGDRIYKILDRLGPVDEDGEEYPLEAKMLVEADRERPEEGRAAELPDQKARPRVRRRDERAAPRRLQVPARDPRGPRHVRGRRRGDRARSSSGIVDEYTQGDVFEEWDLAGLQARTASCGRCRSTWPSSTRPPIARRSASC